MPRYAPGAQVVVKKGGSVSFTDYQGNTHSQYIKGGGGDISRGDMEDLANKIADCSNACQSRVSINNEITIKDADLVVYDEAEGTVANVLVIVLIHDTDNRLDQTVEIPAYDASLLMADHRTPDPSNPLLIAVATRALQIANDDDDELNPDDYHSWRAYTTTRKMGGRRPKVRNIPAPVEPEGNELPPDEPGQNPGA